MAARDFGRGLFAHASGVRDQHLGRLSGRSRRGGRFGRSRRLPFSHHDGRFRGGEGRDQDRRFGQNLAAIRQKTDQRQTPRLVAWRNVEEGGEGAGGIGGRPRHLGTVKHEFQESARLCPPGDKDTAIGIDADGIEAGRRRGRRLSQRGGCRRLGRIRACRRIRGGCFGRRRRGRGTCHGFWLFGRDDGIGRRGWCLCHRGFGNGGRSLGNCCRRLHRRLRRGPESKVPAGHRNGSTRRRTEAPFQSAAGCRRSLLAIRHEHPPAAPCPRRA